MAVNMTTTVTDVVDRNGRTELTLANVKTDANGDPIVTILIDMPSNSPAVGALPKGKIVAISLSPQGVVLSAPAPAPAPAPIAEPEPDPVEEVEVADNVIPMPTGGDPRATAWAGSAAVTDKRLLNKPINDVKNLLGVSGGSTEGEIKRTASAAPSVRSQYPGDTVGRRRG